MKQREQEPPVPPERHATVRAALEAALRAGPVSARELSSAAGIREKDVAEHLEHVEQSARARGERLVVEPAACGDCGFKFAGRKRLTKPGACPECRGTHIDPPLFSLVGGAPARE
jgi:predicted Zn-ribbon and HTH transcriptional regulator